MSKRNTAQVVAEMRKVADGLLLLAEGLESGHLVHSHGSMLLSKDDTGVSLIATVRYDFKKTSPRRRKKSA